MDDYVSDVRDLIEYANGDASTPWGSVRARPGHPELFGEDYDEGWELARNLSVLIVDEYSYKSPS
ncbi:hypothetical protein [Rathayibacter soli]|uniref:hypothetical protein n=1 Tax=Rathayibacter soli TaxID=3144168 RepID=UPI0027E54F45|nr:hypothetical protein [Glaciibacter superstes]